MKTKNENEKKYKDLLKKYEALLKKYNAMSKIADEAISLAEAYSGGESENAEALAEKFLKLGKE